MNDGKGRLVITTSRRPTARTRILSKSLCKLIPEARKVNRGKRSISDLAEEALRNGTSRLLVIERGKGEPSRIVMFKASATGLKPVPPALLITSVKTEINPKTRRKPTKLALILSSSEPESVRRIGESIAGFLQIPILSGADKSSRAFMVLESHPRSDGKVVFRNDDGREVGPSFLIRKATWTIES